MQISEARFLLIAAGLHAGLLVMAFVAPSPAAEQVTARPIEVQVEVEVEEHPVEPPHLVAPAARAETPRNEETPQRTERPATAPNVEPVPIPTVAPTAEPQATGAPVAPPAPGPSATSEYDGPPPAVAMGPSGPSGGLPGFGQSWSTVPGVVPDMGKPAPAPTVSPRATVDPQIATKVLKDAMKEKDKALGLDSPARGAVASAVRGVVQSVEMPAEARVTFEVRLSPQGTVVSVKAPSGAGVSADVLSRIAKSVQAALAGRTLPLSSDYANGAIVSVTAQSTLALPDGTKSTIQQKGAGATFDLANIGAHMQKVVRVSSSIVAIK